jgi:solute carrier family 25 carnitine/acylcarnitine transporter 20/29
MMSHPYPLPYPSPLTSTSTLVTRPSFLSMARHIHSRDGPAGFFRGLGLCLLRAVPVNACAFFVYEGILRGLGAEKVG